MSPAKAAALTISEALKHLKPRREEKPLQDDIETTLRASFESVAREHRLDRQSRIDFLITLDDPPQRIGLEVKTGGSSQGIAAQLLRYALSEQFDALVLLTTSPARGLPHAFTVKGRTIPLVVLNIAHNALT